VKSFLRGRFRSVSSFRRSLLKALVPEFVWPRSVVIDGVSFKVRGEPYSFGTKKLLTSGAERYESDERYLINQALVSGMKVFELGTSIGVLASIIAERIGPAGILVSVEASRKIGLHTKSWIEGKYPWVTVMIGAGLPLWDSEPLQLSINGFDGSRGSLGGSVMFGNSRVSVKSSGKTDEIEIWDIKRLTEFAMVAVDVLIVDIEGGEEKILESDLNLPGTLGWLLIELHPEKYNDPLAGQEILKSIRSEGFELNSNLGNSYLFHRDAEKLFRG